MTKRKNHKSIGQRLLRTLKWLVPLALIVGLVALAFLPKPVEVDIGEIVAGAMILTVDEDGETRVRERFTISAPLAGRTLRVGLDPGDVVKKGDSLATIDAIAPNLLDPRARAQAQALVGAAEATVARATTQHEGSRVDTARLEKAYLRNKALHEKGNVADATFEQAEGAYLAAKHAERAAESAVDMARFDLEQAKAALLRTDASVEGKADPALWSFVILSPIDGRILRIHEESSRIVQPGTALMEIGDPGNLELRIDVLSQDAVKIKPGQRVIVEHWGGEQALTARVRIVEPSAFTKVSALGVDEQRTYVIADFDESQEGADSLGDGYRVEARIVIWDAADVIQVPAGALFRSGGQWAVYSIVGDRAKLLEIKIGRNNGEFAEVLSGLGRGDRVVLHPGDRIEDGSLIKPRSS